MTRKEIFAAARAVPIDTIAQWCLGDKKRTINNGKQEVRYGNHGSISVDIDKNVWYDHQEQQGGDTIELVALRGTISFNEPFDAAKYIVDKFSHLAPAAAIESGVTAPKPLAKIEKQQLTSKELTEPVCEFEWQKHLLRKQTANFETIQYPRLDAQGSVLCAKQIRRSLSSDDDNKHCSWHYLDSTGDNPEHWAWSSGMGERFKESPTMYKQYDMRDQMTIHITEGEKDAQTLIDAGYPAVSPGGTSEWRKSYAPYFADKVVTLHVDNDEAGEKLAQMIIGDIRDITRTLSVVRYPECGDKGDVTDYLRQHTQAEFEQKLARAEVLGAKHLFTMGLDPFTFLDKAPAQIDWLIPNWLEANTLISFTSLPGVGKTTTIHTMALFLACGADYGNLRVPRPIRCALLLLEDSTAGVATTMREILDKGTWSDEQIELIRKNLTLFHVDDVFDNDGDVDSNMITINGNQININDRAVAAFTQLCSHNDLVVCDVLSLFAQYDDKNRQHIALVLNKVFKPIAAKQHCAIMLISHPSRSSANAGANTYGDVANQGTFRANWSLEYESVHRLILSGEVNINKVEHQRQRIRADPALAARLILQPGKMNQGLAGQYTLIQRYGRYMKPSDEQTLGSPYIALDGYDEPAPVDALDPNCAAMLYWWIRNHHREAITHYRAHSKVLPTGRHTKLEIWHRYIVDAEESDRMTRSANDGQVRTISHPLDQGKRATTKNISRRWRVLLGDDGAGTLWIDVKRKKSGDLLMWSDDGLAAADRWAEANGMTPASGWINKLGDVVAGDEIASEYADDEYFDG